MAQAKSSSPARARNFRATAAINPVKISTHIKMDPSRALHSAVTLKSAGVSREPTCCTYLREKSRVMSARSIMMKAKRAAANATYAYRVVDLSARRSCFRIPATVMAIPDRHVKRPSKIAPRPMAPLMLTASTRFLRQLMLHRQLGRGFRPRIHLSASLQPDHREKRHRSKCHEQQPEYIL